MACICCNKHEGDSICGHLIKFRWFGPLIVVFSILANAESITVRVVHGVELNIIQIQGNRMKRGLQIRTFEIKTKVIVLVIVN